MSYKWQGTLSLKVSSSSTSIRTDRLCCPKKQLSHFNQHNSCWKIMPWCKVVFFSKLVKSNCVLLPDLSFLRRSDILSLWWQQTQIYLFCTSTTVTTVWAPPEESEHIRVDTPHFKYHSMALPQFQWSWDERSIVAAQKGQVCKFRHVDLVWNPSPVCNLNRTKMNVWHCTHI